MHTDAFQPCSAQQVCEQPVMLGKEAHSRARLEVSSRILLLPGPGV